MTKYKPLVGFTFAPYFKIKVGYPAHVYTYDHPGPLVTDGHLVRTSPVVSVAEDGKSFETENTYYYLVEEL